MRAVLVSDAAALGIMEVRPEPAWRVRLTGMRNKDLLAPDYGAMHVAAYLKGAGYELDVINVVADVHTDTGLFEEPNSDPDELSGSRIAKPEAAEESRRHLFENLEHLRPDILLVTLSIYNLALYTRELLGQIREACPDSLLVAGGIYSTLNADEILSDGHTDVVVRGEGELTCAELFGRVEAKSGFAGLAGTSYRDNGAVVHNPDRPPIADLDLLPHPYTASREFNIKKRFEILSELLPEGDWIPGAGFLTSRGCPEACTFCLDPAINQRRVRFHSPEYVRAVLDYCSENFAGGAGSFFFGDATFTMNRKRLRKILSHLDGLDYTYQIQTRADYLDPEIVGALASQRFTTVAIGAETFNENVLQEVARKRLSVSDILSAAGSVRDAGMQPVLTFIIGLPGETRDSVHETIEILKENDLLMATFFPLVVFKGTELYRQFIERVSPEERESLRLNPSSEEFLFVSDEFPTGEELADFTEQANRILLEARLQ